MNNVIANWWRSQRFKFAIRSGDLRNTNKILQEIQKSGTSLSWEEKLFRDKQQIESVLQESNRELASLKRRFLEASKQQNHQLNNFLLSPDLAFIDHINKVFQIVDYDEHKIQVTGIDQQIFDGFESGLVEYLEEEFNKFSQQKVASQLKESLEDLNSLKIGKDPDYNFGFTAYVYFMKYFLENTYALYLAWFFIYKQGLLPTKINILDIAAGPATTAYSLALFFQSCSRFFDLPQAHISYYSLEKQDGFQYRGLQFWRKYIEQRMQHINTYFRFVTNDLFDEDFQYKNLPKEFFEFIVISHCFFSDNDKRLESNNIYKKIFAHALKTNGHVLLVVQDKKLFRAFGTRQSEDKDQEKEVVNKFIEELDLELVWYKYLTSTGLRTPLTLSEFAKLAQEKLPHQFHISSLLKKYTMQKYDNSYTLDDYVILAKKKNQDFMK
jgi:hypothetical protein